jgi:hypothetical protein
MFDSTIYIQRRNRLKENIKSGLILFLGNEESHIISDKTARFSIFLVLTLPLLQLL